VQQSICALTRQAAVLINFALHDIVLCAKLELQVFRVSQLSVSWFVLAARLVRAHLDFCALWGQTKWFLLL